MSEVESIRAAHKLGPRKYAITKDWVEHAMRVYHNEVGVLLACIDDLECNNEILAEQLKKRDGFWLAPNEPDKEMLASVDDQSEDKYLARGRAIISYQAMRSNWLERQK